MISVTIPIRTISEANRASHEHWRSRQKRAKSQRGAVLAVLRSSFRSPPLDVPRAVRITRIASRKLDPGNLAASQKHVQDGVADWMGIDDGSPLVSWDYAQERGAPKEFAVRIEVVVGARFETRMVEASVGVEDVAAWDRVLP